MDKRGGRWIKRNLLLWVVANKGRGSKKTKKKKKGEHMGVPMIAEW